MKLINLICQINKLFPKLPVENKECYGEVLRVSLRDVHKYFPIGEKWVCSVKEYLEQRKSKLLEYGFI